MKELNISGKVLGLILIGVIAVSGVVFATTIVGTSGTSAVPTYNDKVVAATTTSFVSDVSNGYKEPEVSFSTESSGSSSGSSSSGSSYSAYSKTHGDVAARDASRSIINQQQTNQVMRTTINSIPHQ